jgi:pyruvate/2-oxoglutarate dehydrogenase complex dihydrolipoamide dehydrogenase (E3) component
VPSKTLIRATESLHQAGAAARFAGIGAEGRLIDRAALIAQKDELVAGLRQAKYAYLLPDYNTIAYVDDRARLAAGGMTVNGVLIQVPKVIIATGARPAVPSIRDIETIDYLTSTSALDLKTLPKRLLVVGGGFAGAELAQLFARAGVKVTVVSRSRLLPAAKAEMSEALADVFREEGISVICGVGYEACKSTVQGAQLIVHRDGREEVLEAERVLVATGRSPHVEELGLPEAGVRQHEGGAIDVDDRMRTSRPGTYAAGIDRVTDHQHFQLALRGSRNDRRDLL